MKLVTDDGTEIDLKCIRTTNVQPGDMLVFRPAEPIDSDGMDKLIRAVEGIFAGVLCVAINPGDTIEVIKEG